MHAAGLPLLLLPKLSEALRRENMVRASGKLGGVAGVLAGVHICRETDRAGGSVKPSLPESHRKNGPHFSPHRKFHFPFFV